MRGATTPLWTACAAQAGPFERRLGKKQSDGPWKLLAPKTYPHFLCAKSVRGTFGPNFPFANLLVGLFIKWLWLKNRYQNGTLVSGNLDQNLRTPPPPPV